MSDRRLRSPTLYPIELRALTLADASTDIKSASNAHEIPTTQNQSFDPSTRVEAEEKLTALSAALPASLVGSERLEILPQPKIRCGIYFLIVAGEVVYVGQSVNVYSRIADHLATGRVFDIAAMIDVPRDDLDMTEGACIRAFRPKLNVTCPAMLPGHDARILAELGIAIEAGGPWRRPVPARNGATGPAKKIRALGKHERLPRGTAQAPIGSTR